MFTAADKSQFQAQAIKEGNHKLEGEPLEIMTWISKQYDVRALDFFRETKTRSNGATQNLVHLILDGADDVKKMQGDRAAGTAIAGRFLKYLNCEVTVTYRLLKALDGKVLSEMLDEEQRTMLRTFESFWAMSQRVVFYHTIAQVKENAENGISKKIGEELARLVEKYGYTNNSPYLFDSKEVFDRDYQGNWYYYWK